MMQCFLARNRFPTLAIWLMALAFYDSPLLGAPQNTKAKRPNVLFILADDQSPFDLAVYDHRSSLATPTLARLAKHGMTIDGAYHMGSFSGAVCTPSRHMIMSGRSLWHLPISPEAKQKGLSPEHLELQTLPAIMKRAGYATMRTCKQGNSYEAANQQFEVRRDETKRGDTDATGSPWHAEQVLQFLDEKPSDRPFFIHFGFSHPHDTRDGPPDLMKKYGAIKHEDPLTRPPANPLAPPLPNNYLAEHPFPHGHPDLRDEVAVSGVWTHRDEHTIRNEIGRQYACSESIDRQIARVLQKLEVLGELNNTYVVYTSDHGIAIGRHGLQGKQNLYQHTWRVPMIIMGPGIPANSRREGNAYLMDLLATICDLTATPIPATNEGLSLRPVLLGDATTIRDTLYGVYCGGTKPGMRAVKQGDWKLIKVDVLEGKVRETQLFHLGENPDELLSEHQSEEMVTLSQHRPDRNQVNLASDPAYAEDLARMEKLLLQEMERWDDPWRLWNQK